MAKPLTVAVARPRCVLGDVAANAAIHAATVRTACARVVVFPQLSLTGYSLARLYPAPPAPNAVPLTVDPRPAAPLLVERAIARLEETGLGHLFFTDADTGRGQLLYRRFDTRYVLLKGTR